MKISNKVGSRDMTNDIEIHGIMLWTSVGLFMPLGIITIRMSNLKNCTRWSKLFFYFHALFQTCSVLLTTAGAILSIKNFENSFNNHHQRIGLALYCAIWVQALSGFCRSRRGSKARCLWYITHWAFGTIISLVGNFNIYTGLQAYRKRTSKSTSLFLLLLASQITLLAFLYLLQDKWDYIKRNKVTSDDETMITCQGDVPQTRNVKEMPTEPSRKSNSLENFFAKRKALKNLFQST